MINSKVLYFVFLFLPFFHGNIALKSDTIKISSNGVNKQVVINSRQIKADSVCSDTTKISGQITQTGKSNQIEIKTTNQHKAYSTKT